MAKKVTQKQVKKAVKTARKHPKAVVAVAIILVIVIAVAAVVWYFKFGPGKKGGGHEGEVASGTLAEVKEAEFSIHFLELGNKYNGDCTLIKCGNTEVLIDAGSRTDSAATINAYLSDYVTDDKIEYVISTHAHQDHIAGFVGKNTDSGKDGVLYTYDVGTIIQFAGHNTNSGIYNSYVSAVAHAKDNGAAVYTALQCWNNEDGAQRSYDLSAAGDGSLTLNVLYNYYYENVTDDENDYSVCVLLTRTAEDNTKSHYLFTGDLEGTGESYLVDRNTLPEVELYKGGHHGSKTSSTDKLLSVIKPKNVVVCCCAGAPEYTVNNNNTFPTQQMIDNVSKYTDKIYVTSLATGLPEKNDNGNYVSQSYSGYTSMNGNIVFYRKDELMKLYCSNNDTILKDTEWFKENRKWKSTE